MKALIIAAGEGKRIRNLSRDFPKPLIPLLGLSLIERAILSAREAGVREFVVVVGFKGKRIMERLGDGSRYGVKIDYIENPDWRRGNGLSVLKAKELISGKFLLMMADNVFDPGVLKDLLGRSVDKGGILVIDRKRREYIDIEDATKVRIEGELIRDIGKGLKDYDGIDCGIFLLSEDVFDAIEESIESGDDTLSGGIKVLAKKGRMRWFDIGERFWVDVDNEESFKTAERLLLKSLVKETDGPISRYLNRPISLRISRYLVNTKVTPNTISWLSFSLSMISGLIYFLGGWASIAIAGLLAQVSSIIDGCDGEVARLKFQMSRYGGWLDSVIDRYADGMIILGMSYASWIIARNYMAWVFGFLALMGSLLNSYTAIKYDQIVKERKVRFRFGRDVRLFVIMLGSLTGLIFFTLIFLSLITNAENIRRLILVRCCQLKHCGAPPAML